MTAAAPLAPRDPRRSIIAKVHVAKKALALTDDSYRDVLRRAAGIDSAKDATPPQLARIMQAFVDLGFDDRRRSPARAKGGRRMPATGDSAHVRKARALWLALFNTGAVRNGSEQALGAFCERQTGKQALQWCDAEELNKVVDGLKAQLQRLAPSQPLPADAAGARAWTLRRQWDLWRWGGAGDDGEAALRTMCALPAQPPLEELDAGTLDRAIAFLAPTCRAIAGDPNWTRIADEPVARPTRSYTAADRA